MADYTPVFTGGVKPFTLTTSAAVTGGTLAESTTTGATATAGAASVKVIGVFAHDAASGAQVSIWPINNCIHETVSTAGVTVGTVVIAGAGGTVEPIAAQTGFERFGLALTTAAAAGKVRWIGRA